MTPTEYEEINGGFEIINYPSKTYDIKFDEDRISGKIDKLEAMKQTIYKILCTDRYKYIIYSYNYGIEIDDLVGRSYSYICSVVKQRVTEALLQDDRVKNVYNFKFQRNKPTHSMLITFNVDTTEGTVTAEKEVIL